jgi:hypothetical protein
MMMMIIRPTKPENTTSLMPVTFIFTAVGNNIFMIECLRAVAYPGILFGGGSTNPVEDRG